MQGNQEEARGDQKQDIKDKDKKEEKDQKDEKEQKEQKDEKAEKEEDQKDEKDEKDEKEEREDTWQEKVQHLTLIIANDCSLKKGKKTKFTQYVGQVGDLQKAKTQTATLGDYLLLSGLYKNLGKLGQDEQSLQKALTLFRKGKGPAGMTVKWILQLTAMKSSLKKHKQCYELALQTIQQSKQILSQRLASSEPSQEQSFVRLILELADEDTKDEIIWKFNEKMLEQELLEKLRRQAGDSFPIPFLPNVDFHIADIMTLETCKVGWLDKPDCKLRELVTYLSIGFFTLATESYYMNDFSHKNDHIKALKMTLTSFDIRCTYAMFLLKILKDHFGEQLQPIAEEKSINGQHNELMILLPAELKEIPLKDLTFPE